VLASPHHNIKLPRPYVHSNNYIWQHDQDLSNKGGDECYLGHVPW